MNNEYLINDYVKYLISRFPAEPDEEQKKQIKALVLKLFFEEYKENKKKEQTLKEKLLSIIE